MSGFHTAAMDRLYGAVAGLQTPEECRRFFEDICTIKELVDMSQRLEVATLLQQGKNYQEISAQTGVSTATISRVNKCLQYGNDGYQMVLSRLKEEEA